MFSIIVIYRAAKLSTKVTMQYIYRAPRDNDPKVHQSSKPEIKLSETSSETNVNLASRSASFVDSGTSKKELPTELTIPLLKNTSLDHYTSHYGSNSYSTNL